MRAARPSRTPRIRIQRCLGGELALSGRAGKSGYEFEPEDHTRLWPRAQSFHPDGRAHGCLAPSGRGNDGPERGEPVGQRRRAGREDQRRLDLPEPPVPHGRNARNRAASRTRPGTNFLPHHEPMMMSGRRGDDLVGRSRTVPAPTCRRRSPANTSMPPADLDQLRHPADAGDHRIVPFLEIDAGPRGRRAPPRACARAARLSVPASTSALSPAPTRRPSVRIMAKMPAMSRWLKA